MGEAKESDQVKVAIIGYGEIGQALSSLISKNHAVQLAVYDKKTDGQSGSGLSLAEVLGGAKVVFFCVNSWNLRQAAADCSPYLGDRAIVAILSKGLDKEKGLTMDEMADELFQPRLCAILSGPMVAEDLQAGLGGAAVVATKKEITYTCINDLFSGSGLRLLWSQDYRGVALAGVLKNIYATVLGIADAAELGDNGRGLLVELSIMEMRQVIKSLGGDEATALGIAGLADYIATGFSDNSTNQKAGKLLWQRNQLSDNAEGLKSLPILMDMLTDSQEFPVLSLLNIIRQEPEKARSVFAAFVNKYL